MEDTAPAQARFGAGSDVISARMQQALALLFPSNLAAKAVLFAVVVALLQLLPMGQTPRMWELPHILLLGLVISYGVFGQRNADDEVAVPVAAASKLVDDDESVESYVSKILQRPLVFDGNVGDVGQDSNGGGKDGGVQAWSSQYNADDPLVVVANAGDVSEKPLLLPVRKLKPAAEEPATGNVSDDGVEETEFVPKEGIGYGGAREYATSSPSSVLDAGVTLSPCSPPPPPPSSELLGSGRRLAKAKARSFNEYRVGDLKMSGRAGLRSGGGGNSSFSSDDMVRDGGVDEDNCELEELEQESSCDEELFELATRPQPEAAEEEEVEDEVDKKADEFIAKFREQIRCSELSKARDDRSRIASCVLMFILL
ncbi:hypothetical protein ACQ4PT_023695 [Festuca glaucescens]